VSKCDNCGRESDVLKHPFSTDYIDALLQPLWCEDCADRARDVEWAEKYASGAADCCVESVKRAREVGE
jgi:C4-type Zn-finger protein